VLNVFQNIKPPQVLHEAHSDFNGDIKVVQVGSIKKIKVDGIDQSIEHTSKACRRLVWGQTVDLIAREQPDVKNILIFGLGGGTMQHLISERFPEASIVSVEIDKVMVDIAREFFELDSIPHHRVIVNDAFRVVIDPNTFGISTHTFDTVIVDIYQGQKFPDLGNSGNFFARLKDLIFPGGLVVVNRIYREEHQFDVDNFMDYMQHVLNGVDSEVVAGYTNSDNVLIYGRT
jgi:spermidine synthase